MLNQKQEYAYHHLDQFIEAFKQWEVPTLNLESALQKARTLKQPGAKNSKSQTVAKESVKKIVEQYQEVQAQATTQLHEALKQQVFPTTAPKTSLHMERLKKARQNVQILIQDIVDEYIPIIEDQLRQALEADALAHMNQLYGEKDQ